MTTDASGASMGSGDGFHNEDAYLVEEGLGLYVVCDGASRRPAGEVASATAVSALEEFVKRAQKRSGTSLARTFSSYQVAGQAVRHALRAVLEVSRERTAFEGMTTTMSMLLAHGRRGAVCHVGDSRVYLHRDGDVHLLTEDHELTSELHEAEQHDEDASRFDTFAIELRPHDTFLLCTDGAEEVVEDLSILGDFWRTPPRDLAHRIVMGAHRRNPECDATVVVVRVRSDEDPAWVWLSKPPQEFAYGHTVAPA